jgi:hypothetical protein
MRLVLACVVCWFVIAAAAAFASQDGGAKKPDQPGRHDRSGSLIVAVLR